jgi:hypothetical protein
MGLLSHMGTNLKFKYLREAAKRGWPGKTVLHRVDRAQFAKGLREAVEGAPKGALTRMGEVWSAPEIYAMQGAGRALGDRMRDMSAGRKKRILKKLRKRLAQVPGAKDDHHIKAVVGGLSRTLGEGALKTGPKRKASILAKLAPVAGLPIGAIDPALVVHGAVNSARLIAAKSPAGKQFFKDQAIRGAKEGLMGHNRTLKDLLAEIAISPALNDSRALARHMVAAARQDPKAVAKLPLVNPKGVVNKARQVWAEA